MSRPKTRRRLVKAAARATRDNPPTPAELARYWETAFSEQASKAGELRGRWLALLELLEQRGLLVLGEVPDERITRFDDAVQALCKGPRP